MNTLFSIFLVFILCISIQAQSVWNAKRSSWLSIDSKDRSSIDQYIKGYSSYLDKARTEITSTKELIEMLKKEGFSEYTNPSQIESGAKLIFNNRNRALIAVRIGSEPINKGSRLIGAHHDYFKQSIMAESRNING